MVMFMFQLTCNSHRRSKTKLHHRNLTDRLIFEGDLMRGLTDLVLQTFLFVFLILSSRTCSKNPESAGIHSEIVHSFALNSLSVQVYIHPHAQIKLNWRHRPIK